MVSEETGSNSKYGTLQTTAQSEPRRKSSRKLHLCCDLWNSVISGRIVCGIQDDQLRVRLLREADLTMEKALDMCRASEIIFTQMKALHDEVEVHKVSTWKANKKGGSSAKESPKTSEKKIDCDRCGFEHEQRKWPAYGQTCRKCDKKNHYAKMCRQSTQK